MLAASLITNFSSAFSKSLFLERNASQVKVRQTSLKSSYHVYRFSLGLTNKINIECRCFRHVPANPTTVLHTIGLCTSFVLTYSVGEKFLRDKGEGYRIG